MNTQMTISEMMDLVYGPLQNWAQSFQGVAKIASDELQAWYYCQNNENVPKFILVWNGDTIRGNFQTAAINRMSDFSFDLIVSRNRGLQIDRGATLVWPKGNAEPLFKYVAQARDLIRCISTSALAEWPIDYRSTTKWDIPGWIVDAYRINYTIANFLPETSEALVIGTSET